MLVIIIVNISVTGATFVLCKVDVKTERLRGHDCRNSGHKIADLELLTERHWSLIFPRLIHDDTFK